MQNQDELKKRVMLYSEGNSRCSLFSLDELVAIGLEAEETARKNGRNFISVFDHLAFVKSIKKGP